MKNIFLILFTIIIFNTAFAQNFQFGILGTAAAPNSNINSQNLYFDINGAYQNFIKKADLENPITLKDINSGYPTSWVIDYVSTEITTICNGKTEKAKGKDVRLSDEQKRILKSADLGTNIEMEVQYNYANPITSVVELRTLHFISTIIPANEAEYIGGKGEMKGYLRENLINKMMDSEISKLKQTKIKFFVNEEGNVSNCRMISNSGNSKIDKLLLEVINKMPKWKPAENNGKKVKQEFVFDMGNGC